MLVRQIPFVGVNQRPYASNARRIEVCAPMLLPFVGLIWTALCLLVIVSIGVGWLWDSVMVTGNMEIESQHYTIYVEDVTHHYRVRLAGTRCFEPLPPWVYPDPDAAPVTPPTPDLGTFFLEVIHNVTDVLEGCYV